MLNYDIKQLAAYLEGEGCFSFKGTPIIVVTSTDLDVIQMISGVWGTNIYDANKKNRKPTVKLAYQTQVAGSYAASLMMQVFPYMSLRRQEQIKAALKKAMESGWTPR